jgi:hypothetical protein
MLLAPIIPDVEAITWFDQALAFEQL